VTLGVVSPRPSELDPTVLSQCSTTFAMRLANETDKNIIREGVGASAQSMIELLPSIADREAIAFGEAVAMPMRMKFSDRSHRPQDRRAAPPAAVQIDLARLAKELEGGESYRHLLMS
jgi:DNA helicase HerA-like ATPase